MRRLMRKLFTRLFASSEPVMEVPNRIRVEFGHTVMYCAEWWQHDKPASALAPDVIQSVITLVNVTFVQRGLADCVGTLLNTTRNLTIPDGEQTTEWRNVNIIAYDHKLKFTTHCSVIVLEGRLLPPPKPTKENQLIASVDFLSFRADTLTIGCENDSPQKILTFGNVRCSDVSSLCKALAFWQKRPLTITHEGKTEMWNYPLVRATIGIVTPTTIDALVVTAVLASTTNPPNNSTPELPQTDLT